METLIFDENEIKRFYDEIILVPTNEINPFDVDFFCISARKKYMGKEDRKSIKFRDSDELEARHNSLMMEETILTKKDTNDFLNKIYKVDSGLDWIVSKNGIKIPKKCMVFYMNVNHIDMIKILESFREEIDILSEKYNTLLNGKKDTLYLENLSSSIKSINERILKDYENPSYISRKTWIDIDLDVSPEKISGEDIKNSLDKMIYSFPSYKELKNKEEMPQDYRIIRTRGGYHILIFSPNIELYNNYSLMNNEKNEEISLSEESFIKALNEMLINKNVKANELKINENGRVPIPGTLQGGSPVKIII